MVRILIVLTILIIIDIYLYQAIKTWTKKSGRKKKKWLKILFWTVPVILISLIIIDFFDDSRRFFYAYIAFFLLYVSKLFGVVVLIVEDIVRLLNWLKRKILPNKQQKELPDVAALKISRSEFISKSALAVTGLHIGTLGWGVISGAHDYQIHRIRLPLKNLPKEFHGIRIAQLSDIHSGSFYNKTAVQGGIEMLLREKPDLVFFTGDLINNQAKELNGYFDVFKKVKAPLGVFSVTGNHDYGDYHDWRSKEDKKRNFERLILGHQELGWDLLMDTHRKITIDNASVGILGIQNWGRGGFSKYGNLEKALKNTEELPVRLLLSHDPSHWREQVLYKTGIDASFAGHTHGLQYGVELGKIKFSPIQWRYKEWAGLYSENDQNLYVNRGFGFLGYPGRVGVLPEITVIELLKA